MKQIYRVTVRGQVLESADLRRLLARAVAEKRAMDGHFKNFIRRDLFRFAPLVRDAEPGMVESRGL
jgi:hypothetical protein